MAQLSKSRHINLFLAQNVYRATLSGAISKYYSFTLNGRDDDGYVKKNVDVIKSERTNHLQH